MESGPERGNVMTKAAQLDKIGVLRERIPRRYIVPQDGKVGLKIFREEAAEHYIAVKNHMNGIDPEGKMAEHIIKKLLVFGSVLLHTLKENGK